MTTNKQAPSKTRGDKQGKVPSQGTPVQKDHQEAPQPKNDSFKENKEKLQTETQHYMYDQSSKFSSVSRTLIFGIIGTIWVITYSEGMLHIPNYGLLISLIFGLLYMLTDVFHYFLDSVSYHKEIYDLDNYERQEDLDKIHEPKMDKINKRSYLFLIIKFVILIIAAVLFTAGLIAKTLLEHGC